jgi:hypothetical protein
VSGDENAVAQGIVRGDLVLAGAAEGVKIPRHEPGSSSYTTCFGIGLMGDRKVAKSWRLF